MFSRKQNTSMLRKAELVVPGDSTDEPQRIHRGMSTHDLRAALRNQQMQYKTERKAEYSLELNSAFAPSNPVARSLITKNAELAKVYGTAHVNYQSLGQLRKLP